ncbi:MAG: sulfatase-like hydrolase/transferase, partial [Gemmatimonadota bacterium]|nr:sulfatase-like hydrolase/transferase [Gemmatimonadota bacterium]
EGLGLIDNTLVIFTSDNGGDPDYGGGNGQFRGEKGTLFEGGIRIPCLMRWPTMIGAESRCSHPCSHIDFYETFSSLTGAPGTRTKTEGLDILPVIKNPGGTFEERTLFWLYRNMAAIRQGHWKYMQIASPQGENTGEAQKVEQLLFDLNADPYEKNDLALVEPARTASLKQKLDSFISGLQGL